MCDQCEELARRVASLESLMGTKAIPIEPDFLYTPKEVAERLRCSLKNVYSLMETGAIRKVSTGASKLLRVKGSAISEFVNSREEGGPTSKKRYSWMAP